MEKVEKLVARLYRITKAQDELVKHKASVFGGQSAYIRKLIDENIPLSLQWIPVVKSNKRES